MVFGHFAHLAHALLDRLGAALGLFAGFAGAVGAPCARVGHALVAGRGAGADATLERRHPSGDARDPSGDDARGPSGGHTRQPERTDRRRQPLRRSRVAKLALAALGQRQQTGRAVVARCLQ
ncbi:MAG: hypothetical protein B7Y96_07430, partial [Comamonadaceae bacterium 32-67-11]